MSKFLILKSCENNLQKWGTLHSQMVHLKKGKFVL